MVQQRLHPLHRGCAHKPAHKPTSNTMMAAREGSLPEVLQRQRSSTAAQQGSNLYSRNLLPARLGQQEGRTAIPIAAGALAATCCPAMCSSSPQGRLQWAATYCCIIPTDHSERHTPALQGPGVASSLT